MSIKNKFGISLESILGTNNDENGTDHKKFPVVCLCGPTRLEAEFKMLIEKLTLEGNIVLAPGVYGCKDPSKLGMLVDLHRQKIDMADRVIIVSGYMGIDIGDHTRDEIRYSLHNKKPITLYSPITGFVELYSGKDDEDERNE